MNTLNNPTKAVQSKEASIMKSARKRAPSSPRAQGGWTIIEIMIGAGLAISLALIAFSNFGDVASTKAQTDAMTEIQDMRTKVQSWRNAKARRGSTSTIGIGKMIQDGMSLSRYTDGVGQNAYGKDLVLTTAATGSDWTLGYGTASASACKFLEDALTNDSNLVPGTLSCTGADLSVTFN
jgi:Tfp pilus assembly major pilin PilA